MRPARRPLLPGLTARMLGRMLGLMFALAASACLRRSPPPSLTDSPAAVRASEPLAFSLPRHPGRLPHSITADRGHVVLLDVWATWCEPCRDALPAYEGLLRQYSARGLRVYAINVDEDVSQVGPFLESLRVSLPVLLDGSGRVSEGVLKVRLMPTSFIIDKTGRVRYVHEGFSEELLGKYQSQIEELLAEP